jgi:5-hydroxyisourate hydrolase-like protein (transthyretin family)
MTVSVHVIDLVYGRAAVGMTVTLSREASAQWRERTDNSGRISCLGESLVPSGTYTLEFDLDEYFGLRGFAPVNSAASIRFRIPGVTHNYSLSVLVTPSAYFAFKAD